MAQAALKFGSLFENVDVRLEKGLSMRTSGVLEPMTALQEVPVFAGPARPSTDGSSAGVRAFRVQGDELVGEGLFDGDYVLVGPSRRPRVGSLVLAETNGHPTLRRAKESRERSDRGDAPNTRVMGVYLGVIRRQGFGDQKSVASGRHRSARLECFPEKAAPLSKFTMLRGQLGMLESTCAGTRNPRLQRALRNEAARVRRQLQNEAGHD